MSRADDEKTPTDDTPVEEMSVDEAPAVAGGHDDTEPEQGEGAQNSY